MRGSNGTGTTDARGRRWALAALVAALAVLLVAPSPADGQTEDAGDPAADALLPPIPDRGEWLAPEIAPEIPALPTSPAGVDPEVEEALADADRVFVLVELAVPTAAEPTLPQSTVDAQRDVIALAGAAVVEEAAEDGAVVAEVYETVPLVAMEVDADALAALEADPLVHRVVLDEPVELATLGGDAPVQIDPDAAQPALTTTQDLLGLSGTGGAWAQGFQGQGWRVAIIDSGVERTHQYFGGRVVAERCFSGRNAPVGAGVCPNGQLTQSGTGAAAPCTFNTNQCAHGTHVAGIAAGGGNGWSASGVARGAGIIAVQAGHNSGGSVSFTAADVVAALEHLYVNRAALNLAAVNLSISNNVQNTTSCNADSAYTPIITNLRAARIPVVISTGNTGHNNGVGHPSCVTPSTAVGNSRKNDDTRHPTSNHGTLVDLMAPGGGTPCESGPSTNDGIISAMTNAWGLSESLNTPNQHFGCQMGTSMAAPHVAGAMALLRQKHPGATVQHLEATLQVTGVGVTGPNNVTRARIQVADALRVLFRDVAVTSPFWSEIGWLAYFNITTGFNDGYDFRPLSSVSRQAMAAFMYRLVGQPAFTPPATATFGDVSTSHPFYKEIQWLVSTGVTTGYPDNTFRPGASVTRMSMAAFMYRLVGQPAFTPPVFPSFFDVSPSHPFYKEIQWLVTTGVTTGYADGTYRPATNVSRQAMAAFMFRLANP